MLSLINKIWKGEEAQDLIEYTLLLAFVALVAAGIFIQAGQSVSGIWGTASNQLVSASTAAGNSGS